MPNTNTDNNETSTSRRGASRSNAGAGVRALKDVAAATVSTENIVDLIERLGLVDIVVNRLRARLETVEVDELIDEIGDYLRRNPEVLVVTMAAITVSAGLIVYLNNSRRDDDDYDEDERFTRPRPVKEPVRESAPRRASTPPRRR
jgi:hypothetical protein